MRAPNRGDYAMREPISPRFRTGEPCLSHAPEAERRRGVNLSLRIKWRRGGILRSLGTSQPANADRVTPVCIELFSCVVSPD